MTAKVQASEGRSGFFKEGTTVTKTTAKFDGGWALIAKKGTTSYFDTLKDATVEGGKALEVGMPIYLAAWADTATSPLKEGDEIIPLEKGVSCWTTDCPYGASEGETDSTTQCDIIKGKKDIHGDGNITNTGTISGLYMNGNEMQAAIEGTFIPRIIHTGTADSEKVTYVPREEDKTFWHWFTFRETTVAGDIEKTIIREMRISSFDAGQPSSGMIPFNFGYTTLQTFSYSKEVA